MTDLFLIFLSAAMFENLALAYFAERDALRAGEPTPLLLATSSLLVVLVVAFAILPHAWVPPARGVAFAHALALISVCMASPAAFAQAPAGTRISAEQWLRQLLPALVATLGTLAFAMLDARRPHPLRQSLWFCILAASALLLIGHLFGVLRRHLDGRTYRGWSAPLTILAALALAIAGAGLGSAMP